MTCDVIKRAPSATKEPFFCEVIMTGRLKNSVVVFALILTASLLF